MNQYFSAIDLFLEDRCLLDATTTSPPSLLSLGIENILKIINPRDNTQSSYNLPTEFACSAISLAPDLSHCILGTFGSIQYNFANGAQFKLFETIDSITTLKYSAGGKFIAAGSKEGKVVLYQTLTGRKEKCRPGHQGDICSIFISRDEKFFGSIGMDQTILVYKWGDSDPPSEVAKYPVTKLQDCRGISASFHFSQQSILSGGLNNLQKLEEVADGKWIISKTAMSHPTPILAVQIFRQNAVATSTLTEVCIWSIAKGEKLFEVEQFHLTRMVAVEGRFYGVRDDGKLYSFKRQFREEQPMEVEESINFSVKEGQEEINEQGEEDMEYDEVKEQQFYEHKKSKADKIITCYPQNALTTATRLFQQSRFLFVNAYGCVIQHQEGDQEIIIQIQFQFDSRKKALVFRNRKAQFFDITGLLVLWASQNEFGIKPSPDSSLQPWQCSWPNLQAVAAGPTWLAVASELGIKLLDVYGHQIKTIAFDRQIVALRAHQNMLVVIYHEGVPMNGCQLLAMRVLLVDQQESTLTSLADLHVPLSPESVLRWIGFSKQGMLFSQDSAGNIRALSLQSNQWTTVAVVEVQEPRKVWIIGVNNYQLIYWKTTDQDSEPTVAPRFNTKKANFYIPTVGVYPENTQQLYEQLLWQRFTLDHEKARSRLWGRLKVSRPTSSPFFYLSETIKSQKQNAKHQMQLDQKYYPLIEAYLKAGEPLRALNLCVSCIRTLEAGSRVVELFDLYNKRALAIQLQQHYQERQRQLEYEKMQVFEFVKLREEAEKTIKPRSLDPMRRAAPKKLVDPIPSFSQSSQDSAEEANSYQNRSEVSSQPISESLYNPFLKKKSNHQLVQTKKREIDDQAEKYGVKRKADQRINRRTAKPL